MVTVDKDFKLLEDGSVILTLGEHCIETAARRAHRMLVSEIFANEGNHLRPSIELLEEFLTNSQFSVLRTTYPELAGGLSCEVRLWRDSNGQVRWERFETKHFEWKGNSDE